MSFLNKEFINEKKQDLRLVFLYRLRGGTMFLLLRMQKQVSPGSYNSTGYCYRLMSVAN
jgi:hypothetical protein